MSAHRNFWFLQGPLPGQRLGRYVLGADLLIGSCVEADDEIDENGQRSLGQASANTPPKKGKHGILVYENPFAVMRGVDPVEYALGDFKTAPEGQSTQLVSGDDVRFRLKNTALENLQGQKTYPAFLMVEGLGATPTIGIDDFIGPSSTPDGVTNGYWQECSEANAWAIVTAVYDTDELDAQLIF